MLDFIVMQTGQEAVGQVIFGLINHEMANDPKQLVVLQNDADRDAVKAAIPLNFEGIVVTVLSMAEYLAQLPDLMEG